MRVGPVLSRGKEKGKVVTVPVFNALAKAFVASVLVTRVAASCPGVSVVIRLRAFAIQSRIVWVVFFRY